MSNAIEGNKLTVTIKTFMRIQFILETYVYKKNNHKRKMNFPLPPSTSITVFLNAEKLLSL